MTAWGTLHGRLAGSLTPCTTASSHPTSPCVMGSPVLRAPPKRPRFSRVWSTYTRHHSPRIFCHPRSRRRCPLPPRFLALSKHGFHDDLAVRRESLARRRPDFGGHLLWRRGQRIACLGLWDMVSACYLSFVASVPSQARRVCHAPSTLMCTLPQDAQLFFLLCMLCHVGSGKFGCAVSAGVLSCLVVRGAGNS